MKVASEIDDDTIMSSQYYSSTSFEIVVIRNLPERRLNMPSFEIVFSMYQRYVDCVRDAVAERGVSRHFLVPKLSQPEFEVLWETWGKTPKAQDVWSRRFARGYEREAQEALRKLSERIDTQNVRSDAA